MSRTKRRTSYATRSATLHERGGAAVVYVSDAMNVDVADEYAYNGRVREMAAGPACLPDPMDDDPRLGPDTALTQRIRDRAISLALPRIGPSVKTRKRTRDVGRKR